MKFYKAALIVGSVLAVAAGGPALAHHSFPATYFTDQQTSISGTVVQFLFRNPHSFVHVMAPDKDGKMQRWAIEWGGGAALARERITSTTLKPGDKVTISGNPGRVAADHRIRMQKITRPSDGWTWGGEFE
jgi:hypothetical protein